MRPPIFESAQQFLEQTSINKPLHDLLFSRPPDMLPMPPDSSCVALWETTTRTTVDGKDLPPRKLPPPIYIDYERLYMLETYNHQYCKKHKCIKGRCGHNEEGILVRCNCE